MWIVKIDINMYLETLTVSVRRFSISAAIYPDTARRGSVKFAVIEAQLFEVIVNVRRQAPWFSNLFLYHTFILKHIVQQVPSLEIWYPALGGYVKAGVFELPGSRLGLLNIVA